MLKLEADKMKAAIERAKAEHLKVRIVNLDSRTYAVKDYTVKFTMVNGHKFADCSCPARGLCKHIAAAAQANVMCQSVRRASAVVSEEDRMRAFIRKNTGWML